MKLTERQSLILFLIAKTAVNIHGGFAGLTSNDILQLVNEIINQQPNTLTLDDDNAMSDSNLYDILTKYGAIPTDWRLCMQELDNYYAGESTE